MSRVEVAKQHNYGPDTYGRPKVADPDHVVTYGPAMLAAPEPKGGEPWDPSHLTFKGGAPESVVDQLDHHASSLRSTTHDAAVHIADSVNGRGSQIILSRGARDQVVAGTKNIVTNMTEGRKALAAMIPHATTPTQRILTKQIDHADRAVAALNVMVKNWERGPAAVMTSGDGIALGARANTDARHLALALNRAFQAAVRAR